MPRLRYKSFATPDEVRPIPKGRAAVVNLDEATVARSEFNPGWRWSTDLAPIMGTNSCQVHHLGHAVSGILHVRMDDGEALDIPPDSIYEIPPGHDAWVVGDEPWLTVEWTSARIVGIGPEGPGARVLATVLFTDIVDSTAMLERMGDRAWQELLRLHNARLRDDLNSFRGREVKTTGDGFLAVFDGATRAVRCAAAMTRSAHDLGLAIRVGMHTGEVEFVGADVRGVAVHAAARVMSLAGPDEVFVTSTTSELLDGSDVVLEEAGIHELKGLSGRRQVFRLVISPMDADPARGKH
ncbi:MAG TPA: adenylate/guanylate cyclase domain-containing protein [Candidatus Limnocylindrales bacterium]